mgnify:CR=1 FL=1
MSQKRFPEEFKIEAVKQVTEKGKPVADVAQRRRAEQRVRNGMTDGIAVGVTGAMPVGRDVDAAQSHRSALAEPVRVVADTNAQRQRRAHAATVACACAPPLMSE